MKAITQPEVLASIIAFLASLIAIFTSLKMNKNSRKLEKEINNLQLVSEDKQRLVEVISSERVEWINKVRNSFADFNTDAYVLSSKITQTVVQKVDVNNDINVLIPRMVSKIEILELYLNPTEKIVEKQLKNMNNIIRLFTEFTQTADKANSEDLLVVCSVMQESYQKELKQMMYFQQVLLKAEWKRVKLETAKGKQIPEEEMNSLILEVAEKTDSTLYENYLREDFKNISTSNFVGKLIEMTERKDKKFKIFVDENLFAKESSLAAYEINKNIKALKMMDSDQQLLIQGRADHFKESNDPSKYFPSVLVLFGLIITFTATLKEITGTFIFTVISSTILILILLRILYQAVLTYPTAVYFHSLVSNINKNN